MSSENVSKIIYTEVDEAPALATYSFLPIVQAFMMGSGIEIETRDISLSGRIIANFSDYLTDSQRQTDALAELGTLAKRPEANIIKLPNISASIPQLKAAIKELQGLDYAVPDFPDDPSTEEENNIRARYARVLGSAVNPVLREGNSDRRAPRSVKAYAKNHPHRMGEWTADNRSHVAWMTSGDFRHNERSVTLADPITARIEFVSVSGEIKLMKDGLQLQAGEVVDASFMSRRELRLFLASEIADAKEKGLLFSLHLKATMMKVSDPIIFGHGVTVFFDAFIEKHGDLLGELGVNFNTGLQDLEAKIAGLPADKRGEIDADIKAVYAAQPDLAMVNSDKGISNLHVPSDVIIDASMPAMIRESGKMWGPDGRLAEAKAVIPESSYAGIYQAVIDDCKTHGALDPRTMGSISNVGLMAQKAEEYGSHDKTFEVEADGEMRIVGADGAVLIAHRVEQGDIWRMCQVKDLPVRDWVKLAVTRARVSETPAVFWLDDGRAHDRELVAKVRHYLKDHDTRGLDIHIMSPVEATKFSLERMRRGLDTISVTGNVLRDYNTDLFPILEVGTSAKMLSIVPLMNGGGLFETGAGGSAPKLVQQFVEEGHLRWDSLGEFLALAASFEHLSRVCKNHKAAIFAQTLDVATGRFLDENKSPSRKVGELDSRGSHFYLALYWAQALADQADDSGLRERFKGLADDLMKNEQAIVDELAAAQGRAVEIGGYYRPNPDLVSKVMRPSDTFNAALAALNHAELATA